MSAAVRENSAALDGVLDAFKGMASAWHYLLLDGIQCAGPSSSPLAWGAHERSSGAAEPCEVAQTTWETAAARNFVHSYECRMGPAPGWCVGAFGQAASTRVPVEHAYIGVDRVFLNGAAIAPALTLLAPCLLPLSLCRCPSPVPCPAPRSQSSLATTHAAAVVNR